MKTASAKAGDGFTSRYAKQAVAGAGVVLAILLLDESLRDIFELPATVGVCLWLAIMAIVHACRLRWRRAMSGVAGFGIYVSCLYILLTFESGIHFFLMQPLYRLEVALMKPDNDGHRRTRWNWPLTFGWGTYELVYDDQPAASITGTDGDRGCAHIMRSMAAHFFFVRTACWS